MKTKYTPYIVGALILLGFAARLLPHPANVAPIGAIALFGGLYLPKRFAILAPLAGLLLSDAIIGFYSIPMMVSVYGSFIIMGLFGLWARKKKNVARVVGGTLMGSIAFFLVTNAAVWLFGTMYSPSLSGLMQSYTMALPFFRNSLIGDFFFVGVLVGGYESAVLLISRLSKNLSPSILK